MSTRIGSPAGIPSGLDAVCDELADGVGLTGLHAARATKRIAAEIAWLARLIIGPRVLSPDVLQLCVMSPKQRAERVGVRQLRQNLSVYLKHVREEGRGYEVTERGEPVAHLTPMPDRQVSTYERMLAEGRITPAKRSWEEFAEPLPPLPGKQLSEVLREMRDEDTG
jgi:prevent-host-death family protein